MIRLELPCKEWKNCLILKRRQARKMWRVRLIWHLSSFADCPEGSRKHSESCSVEELSNWWLMCPRDALVGHAPRICKALKEQLWHRICYLPATICWTRISSEVDFNHGWLIWYWIQIILLRTPGRFWWFFIFIDFTPNWLFQIRFEPKCWKNILHFTRKYKLFMAVLIKFRKWKTIEISRFFKYL